MVKSGLGKLGGLVVLARTAQNHQNTRPIGRLCTRMMPILQGFYGFCRGLVHLAKSLHLGASFSEKNNGPWYVILPVTPVTMGDWARTTGFYVVPDKIF